MVQLTWDGPRFFDSGVERGVIFLSDNSGVAWNGLIAVSEDSEDTMDLTRHFDGLRYVIPTGIEDFSATIESFTYPDEFEDYTGYADHIFGEQPRRIFGLSYRTGDKIHIVYNAMAAPTTRARKTLSRTAEPATFTWDISTTPVSIPGGRPSAHIIVDTNYASPEAVSELEDVIYGTESTDSHLPTVDDIIDIFDEHALFVVIDHGDGTWTAIGPDEMIQMTDSTSFQITVPSAIYLDDETYSLSNY